MNLLIMAAMLLAPPPHPRAAGKPFLLEPGDFRWVPFTVRQTPSEVDCQFEVLRGNPSVHLELLPMSEFRSFDRGEDHDTLAVTPKGRTGEFHRIIDARGQYAVVVENAAGAEPATILLRVETKLNPRDVARALSPQRRIAVLLLSFAFLFSAILIWPGRRLFHVMRSAF